MLLHDLKRRAMLQPDDAAARYDLGEALLAERDFEGATKQLEKALSLCPDHGAARRALARAYLGDGRATLAERTLEEAVKRRPDDAGARDELAAILVDGGRLDDAILHLEEGIAADPCDVSRLVRTAELSRRRGLLTRARGHFERAAHLAPGDPEIARGLRDIALELGEADPALASPLLRGRAFLLGRARAALEAPPLREAAFAGALRDAAVQLRRDDLPGAKRALMVAHAAEQATPAFELLRAELTLLGDDLANRDLERAEKAFRRCVDRHPGLAMAWGRLAEIASARGQLDEAALCYASMLALSPDEPDACEGLGDVLVALGRREDAAAAYQRALAVRADGVLAAKLADLRSAARRAQDDERPVGRIGALGWGPHGGTVSMLEAVAVPGKGELIFTGSIGKTGQDAARVAASCLKARAVPFGITDLVARLDLHLHFVDTEFKKDGPSAGLALALAGLSAYTQRPLRPRLAATGEITLQGAVRPVGGLHEKLLAAYLGGITTVLVPRKNLFELRSLSREVASRVSLVYVDSLAEALEHALLGGEGT